MDERHFARREWRDFILRVTISLMVARAGR
jgi:hypothetical protein